MTSTSYSLLRFRLLGQLSSPKNIRFIELPLSGPIRYAVLAFVAKAVLGLPDLVYALLMVDTFLVTRAINSPHSALRFSVIRHFDNVVEFLYVSGVYRYVDHRVSADLTALLGVQDPAALRQPRQFRSVFADPG